MVLKKFVKWGIIDVAVIVLLRIGLGFFFNSFILPYLKLNPMVTASLADRFFLVGLTFYVVIRIYHGSLRDLGLKIQPLGANILIGLIGGAVLFFVINITRFVISTFMVIDLQTHPLVRIAAGAETPRGLLVPLFLAGVLAPLAEEIFYRGLAFPAFRKYLGLMGGVFVSSLFFAVMHFTAAWIPEITLAGAGLAVIYYWTGSLIPGMVAHAVVNSLQLLAVYLFR